MRRLITLLALAVSLLLVTAVVPAAAKKPVPKPAAFYDVTLQITGENGLGMCDGSPQSLTMVELVGKGASGSALLADGTEGTFGTGEETSEPRLYLRADVPADRDYEPIGYLPDNDDNTFDGCHGGALGGSDPPDVPSYFIIHSDSDGNMSNVLWAFDLYKTEGTKGKDKTPGVKEYFRLWGTWATFTDTGEPDGAPCPLTPLAEATCHVSGPFQVWHYYPIEQIGVDQQFDFEMTITPVPPPPAD